MAGGHRISSAVMSARDRYTLCDAVLLANISFHETFMSFLKHFCKHKQLLRTLASSEYPVTFSNVVAFPVFIFPPPGPLAQQTAWGFFFIWLCLPGASIPGGAALAQWARGCAEAPGVLAGIPGDQEEMHIPGTASSAACAGSRDRNLNFLGNRLMGPTASLLPAGAGQQMGRPTPGHPFPGLFCALGSRCARQPG